MTPAEVALYRNLDLPVVTFTAYRKADGVAVTVDRRTFDPELHSMDPIEPPAQADA